MFRARNDAETAQRSNGVLGRKVSTVALWAIWYCFYTRPENLKEGIGRQLTGRIEAHAFGLALKEAGLAASLVGLDL
ncbi:hypothetical protein C7T94_07570 [Pedobacter yulinensis]|uniref:Uncharacterized protein n=1 Tax=Pedobacter yulinensis TaxID=2126353 RepID=A0A2T3HJ95_9SPHI|nr:hypothetical protein C7T94_07570 [Pedobacter yulinensis]